MNVTAYCSFLSFSVEKLILPIFRQHIQRFTLCSVHRNDSMQVRQMQSTHSRRRGTSAFKLFSVKRSNEMNSSIENLKEILGIRDTKAQIIVKKYPALGTESLPTLSSNCNCLLKRNISLERIIENPWLLRIDHDTAEMKLNNALKLLPLDSFEEVAPFIKQSVSGLVELTSMWKRESLREPTLNGFRSRLHYLAFHLECSNAEVADMMAKVKRLQTIPFSKLSSVLHVLLDSGISRSNIKADPWIFTHNVNTIKERLRFAADQGVPEIKPWTLRCPTEMFEKHIRRSVEEWKVCGGNDISIFLQERLHWSPSQILHVHSRVPLLKNISASKLEKMITLLYSNGFTSEDIAATPRILRHSVDTVSEKLAELSELSGERGLPKNTLSLLSQSSKIFLKFTASQLQVRRYRPKVRSQTSQ